MERLYDLAEGPVTRIGLSATQRPIEEMARFLIGNDNIGEDGAPDCLIVDSGHARNLDLAIELPPRELGPIASHEQWAETLDDISALVQSHGTTLVFVNTRRMVERIAHQLSQRLGEEAVVAHHGSLARTTRLAAEEKLKTGEVKVCVATASLELGDRHRRGRPRLPDRVSPLNCGAATANRPLGPLAARHPQGPTVPPDPR